MSRCRHVWDTYYARAFDEDRRECRRCHRRERFDDWFYFGIFGTWKEITDGSA